MSGARLRALKLLGEGSVPVLEDGSAVVGSGRGAMRLSSREAAAMASEGLVAMRGGRLRRTDAGRAYLRRALAGGENPFAGQHREMRATNINVREERVEVSVNAAESPLAWLAGRRDRKGAPLLTHEQYEAGRRLACDHARGHGEERITQSWDASGVRGEAPRDRLAVTEAAVDARRRVERALAATGPGLADVLVAVCCEEVGLETVEKRLGWPARSAKVVLRLALDRLAEHYGIGSAARGPGRTQIVSWGAAGYRPSA